MVSSPECPCDPASQGEQFPIITSLHVLMSARSPGPKGMAAPSKVPSPRDPIVLSQVLQRQEQRERNTYMLSTQLAFLTLRSQGLDSGNGAAHGGRSSHINEHTQDKISYRLAH